MTQPGKTNNSALNPRRVRVTSAVVFIVAIIVIASMVVFKSDTPEAQANWYNDSWLYRKTLTINPAQVAGDITNFPVLVSVLN